MPEALLAVARDLRLADLLDIALVTVFLYSAIALVRRTRARLVAGGVVLLVGLFLVARALDLRLTTWLLQGFFAVFVVMLVVIFQEELRQLFERLALWGLRRRTEAGPSGGAADVVLAGVRDLARAHTGALIVLVGRQPIDRHLSGGVALDGILSEALLKSIFDKHSAGHDGAVIIEGDRLRRFGAQLPLSTDFRQLEGVGTRHGAALGLSERSDALCLVVSEERGLVSLARGGRLRRLADPAAVAAEVQAFRSKVSPPADRQRVLMALVRENWVEKITALLLVIALWYLFVPGSRPASEAFPIDIKVVNLPPGFALEGVEPERVMAVFAGQRRAFYLFDPSRIEVTVDASLARYGRRTFTIAPEQIRHPADLTVEDVEPEQVRISLRPLDGVSSPLAEDEAPPPMRSRDDE